MNVRDVLRYVGSILAVVLTVRALVPRRFAALDQDVSTQRPLHLVAPSATGTPEALRCPHDRLPIQLILLPRNHREKINVLRSAETQL